MLTAECIEGFTFKHMPNKGETIADYLYIDELIKYIESIHIYKRSAKECPLAQGNWMLDIRLKNGTPYFWRFPPQMSAKFAKKFFAPIVELDKKRMREMEH